ncbi:hypothetical protein I5907_17540 [Panacibacter sp. DH6]|uniref:Uncharacterized protein n=1 Tax=Panacibacter microcysteis TaxID=2793269 RepID=A0A931GZ62_9BACT|nr:hypothetical protein [Panacibacter microcysteis]MBG9378046.1 hypothetical protein [Panacibacter microcysteis]
MKKHLLYVTVAMVLAIAAMGKQVIALMTPAKPVEKSVSFALYKEGNYAADIYHNTFAGVHIVIEKVNGKSRKKVWDKTFDAQMLQQYPSMQEAIAQTVSISNVFDNKEHLEVSYTLTYNTKGSELQMQSGIVVKGNGNDKVYIGI